ASTPTSPRCTVVSDTELGRCFILFSGANSSIRAMSLSAQMISVGNSSKSNALDNSFAPLNVRFTSVSTTTGRNGARNLGKKESRNKVKPEGNGSFRGANSNGSASQNRPVVSLFRRFNSLTPSKYFPALFKTHIRL